MRGPLSLFMGSGETQISLEEMVPELLQVSVSELIPYARNARTHSETQVAEIAASIREFGFNNPVLLRDDNTIIAGHGRVLAARKLGLPEVPCIYLSHLTEAQARAYVLADNQLATHAGWATDMLGLELDDLLREGIEPGLLGFTNDDMKRLAADFLPGTIEDQGKLDTLAPKMIECPHCGKEFDSRGM